MQQTLFGELWRDLLWKVNEIWIHFLVRPQRKSERRRAKGEELLQRTISFHLLRGRERNDRNRLSLQIWPGVRSPHQKENHGKEKGIRGTKERVRREEKGRRKKQGWINQRSTEAGKFTALRGVSSKCASVLWGTEYWRSDNSGASLTHGHQENQGQTGEDRASYRVSRGKGNIPSVACF